MSTLLKLVHVVYSFAVCSIVAIAVGFFTLNPQIQVNQEITQSCVLPEIIDTKVSITISEENPLVNCRNQRVRVTQNGSLVIKTEGEFAEIRPELMISSLIIDEGGALAIDQNISQNNSLAQRNPVTITFAGFSSLQQKKVFEYAELSPEGNLLSLEKSSVLGVKSDSNDISSVFPGIILRSTQASVDELSSESATVTTSIDGLVSQMFACNEGTECRNDGLFVSGLANEFPFALKEPSQLEGTKILAEGQSNGASVLGVSGKVIPVGSFVERNGIVSLKVSIDPKYYIPKEQGIAVEFEVKPINVPYDGIGDIYTSEKKTFQGDTSLTMSVDIESLEKNASYKWRARIVNISTNEKSEWMNYANESESLPAFVTSTAKKLELSVQRTTVSTQEKISVTVKALNDKGEIDKDFRGIIKFASDQQTADLPQTYAFTKSDAGQKTFIGSVKFYESGRAFITAVDVNNYSLSSTASFIVNRKERSYLVLGVSNLYPLRGDKVNLEWQSEGISTIKEREQQYINQKTGRFSVISTVGEIFKVEGLNSNGTLLIASANVIPNSVESKNNGENISEPSEIIPTVEGVSTTAFPPLPEEVYPNQEQLQTVKQDEVEIPEVRNSQTCPQIGSFESSRAFLKPGMVTTLSWNVKDAERVVIDSLPGTLPLAGSASLTVNETETISIKAINGKCQRSEQLSIMTVSVYPWEGTGAWLAGILALEVVGGAAVLVAEKGVKYNLWAAISTFIAKFRKKKRLGVVFDTDTKLPIAGARVEIYDLKGVKKITQAISDNYGCVYIQDIGTGHYSLKVKKYGFKLFDQKEKRIHFTRILKGAFFHIKNKDDGPLAISMKQNKRDLESPIYHIALLFEEVVTAAEPLLLVAGFLYSATITLLYPVVMNWVFFGLYLLFACVKIGIYLSKAYSYGVVRTINGLPVANVHIGLYSRDSKELLAETKTDTRGQYIFFAPRGSYMLRIMDESYRLLAKNNLKNSILVRPDTTEDDIFSVSRNLFIYPTAQKDLKRGLKFK